MVGVANSSNVSIVAYKDSFVVCGVERLTSQYDYYEFLKAASGELFSSGQIARKFGDCHSGATIKLAKLCRFGLIDRIKTNRAGSFLYGFNIRGDDKSGII